MIERLLHFLIALDQFIFSIITLGKAYPNESLSSAAYKGEQEGKILPTFFRPLIDKILYFDPDHCHQAYLNVKQGLQLPPSYTE